MGPLSYPPVTGLDPGATPRQSLAIHCYRPVTDRDEKRAIQVHKSCLAAASPRCLTASLLTGVVLVLGSVLQPFTVTDQLRSTSANVPANVPANVSAAVRSRPRPGVHTSCHKTPTCHIHIYWTRTRTRTRTRTGAPQAPAARVATGVRGRARTGEQKA